MTKNSGYIIDVKINGKDKEIGEYYELSDTLKVAGNALKKYGNVSIVFSDEIDNIEDKGDNIGWSSV